MATVDSGTRRFGVLLSMAIAFLGAAAVGFTAGVYVALTPCMFFGVGPGLYCSAHGGNGLLLGLFLVGPVLALVCGIACARWTGKLLRSRNHT